MLKPKTLRTALIEAVPVLRDNPSMLRLWVDKGRNTATLSNSLSFEKQFSLNIAVSGFADDIDTLFVPVMAWLRDNQPEILTTEAGRNGCFSWTLVTNADGTQDLNIVLQLTERTKVTEVNGALYAETLAEPLPPAVVNRPTELYINGELVSRWPG
ncbi:phage tail protein [Enterobacter sp. Bisph1]|uniref:phage tail protein n=1 Tax=Enterobacter sp. Bisph1 TaxID=1274399 RepID=UPI00057C01B0|nr:phage tail protein [Enterobacter sp. Bisph1]